MGGEVAATRNAARARPEPEPAARRRSWPAVLAWALYGLVLLLFATYPVLDRRHDAARIIERFGSHLRDQVDLDTLTAEVLAVAEQTIQPIRASLWLRPPPGSGAA
jgi:hypothetical protein